jgi:hypothetical protein
MTQHYSATLSESKRMLYYSGPKAWVTVTILLPDSEYYKLKDHPDIRRILEEALDSIKFIVEHVRVRLPP